MTRVHSLLRGLPVFLLSDVLFGLLYPTLTVIPGAHPWLEVYVDGVLTSEWQPSDGVVYWVLLDMVEREEVLLARRAGDFR